MGVREVGVLVIEVDIGLHAFGHPSGDESLDCGLFLGSDSLLFSVMSLPFRGEEVGEVTQPLTFSLDLLFSFAEAPQPEDISCHPHIPNSLYGSHHHIVQLEAFSQQI